MNTTILEANIQHLKPNTEYVFRVVSYNKLGPSRDSVRLTVRTEPEGEVKFAFSTKKTPCLCMSVNHYEFLKVPPFPWTLAYLCGNHHGFFLLGSTHG